MDSSEVQSLGVSKSEPMDLVTADNEDFVLIGQEIHPFVPRARRHTPVTREVLFAVENNRRAVGKWATKSPDDRLVGFAAYDHRMAS